jgi:RimJ/RimL family protein N-acetyltransferase
VTLREAEPGDARPLLDLLSTPDVARLMSPPPSTLDCVEHFIGLMRRGRASGEYACFVAVPRGSAAAAGLFQIHRLQPGFRLAEWGFALAQPYWGTGTFAEAAALVLRFAFDTLGVDRLEARAALLNGRGNGALAKLGAVRELVLRRAFRLDGRWVDQALWSLLADDWRRSAARVARVQTCVH